MPWTGTTFLIGAAAIAGLPPLNGFASEWLTLQALLHVPAAGGVPDGVLGAAALAGLAATAALAVYCFVKVVGLTLLGPARRPECEQAQDPPGSMRFGLVFLAGTCVVLGDRPGRPLLAARRPRPMGRGRAARDPGSRSPRRAGYRPQGSRSSCSCSSRSSGSGAAHAEPHLPRAGRRDSRSPRRCSGRAPASRSRCALSSRPILRPEREIAVRSRGGVVQEVSYSGRVPQLADEWLYRPVAGTRSRRPLGAGACKAAGSGHTSPT